MITQISYFSLLRILVICFSLGLSFSYASEKHTAEIHTTKGMSCASCHDTNKPEPMSEVDANKCMQCHGSRQSLAEKFKHLGARNPHQNHLGDIECALCHKGHEKSQSYCLQCHKDFQMPMK